MWGWGTPKNSSIKRVEQISHWPPNAPRGGGTSRTKPPSSQNKGQVWLKNQCCHAPSCLIKTVVQVRFSPTAIVCPTLNQKILVTLVSGPL